jgi:preprotein translocase subunit YajC
MKRVPVAIIFFLISRLSVAQVRADTAASSMDSLMRSHDKIYVVMAVCITILVVFFLYLIRIDRKVSKKEKSV